MKTVGEILKQERKKQGKSLKEISQQTKIPLSSLEFLETDNFSPLPSAVFIKGFIKSYARCLRLDSGKVLAVFRRDYESKEKDKIVLRGTNKSLDQSVFWTPRTMIISLFTFALMIIVSFLFLQLRGYLFAPSLKIFSPQEGERLNSLIVEVKGKTIPDASLFINNRLASIDFDGSFSYKLELLPGETVIKVKAVNRRGKEREIKRRVVVDKSE